MTTQVNVHCPQTHQDWLVKVETFDKSIDAPDVSVGVQYLNAGNSIPQDTYIHDGRYLVISEITPEDAIVEQATVEPNSSD